MLYLGLCQYRLSASCMRDSTVCSTLGLWCGTGTGLGLRPASNRCEKVEYARLLRRLHVRSRTRQRDSIVGTNAGVVCLARVACYFVRVFTCLCATSPEMMQVEKGSRFTNEMQPAHLLQSTGGAARFRCRTYALRYLVHKHRRIFAAVPIRASSADGSRPNSRRRKLRTACRKRATPLRSLGFECFA